MFNKIKYCHNSHVWPTYPLLFDVFISSFLQSSFSLAILSVVTAPLVTSTTIRCGIDLVFPVPCIDPPLKASTATTVVFAISLIAVATATHVAAATHVAVVVVVAIMTFSGLVQ